jgi:hypothetical protein
MNVRVLVVPVLAAVAAAGIWLLKSPPGQHGVPAATWRIGTGTEIRQGHNYDELPIESPIRLSYSCDEPRHVYVFGYSAVDGTVLMFPSPPLRTELGNPLPPGGALLPGASDGEEIAWTTRSGILATTVFLVVAATEPIADLEALLPKLRRWTNTVLPDGSIQVTNPDAGVELAGKAREPLPLPLLQRAADLSLNETMINGPLRPDPVLDGVWIGSWRVKEKQSDDAPAPK